MADDSLYREIVETEIEIVESIISKNKSRKVDNAFLDKKWINERELRRRW